MLKAGIRYIAEATSEQLLKSLADARYVEQEAMTDEQREFDRRIRIAQNVLGFVCPPAGKAMLALEYGPLVAAEVIKKTWDSDAAKCLGGWLKRRS